MDMSEMLWSAAMTVTCQPCDEMCLPPIYISDAEIKLRQIIAPEAFPPFEKYMAELRDSKWDKVTLEFLNGEATEVIDWDALYPKFATFTDASGRDWLVEAKPVESIFETHSMNW